MTSKPDLDSPEAIHTLVNDPLMRPVFMERGKHFHQTLDERFSGPMTDRAHQLADRILAHLQRPLPQGPLLFHQ